MDPNATWRQIQEILATDFGPGALDEARYLARELNEWIARGGFPPNDPTFSAEKLRGILRARSRSGMSDIGQIADSLMGRIERLYYGNHISDRLRLYSFRSRLERDGWVRLKAGRHVVEADAVEIARSVEPWFSDES